MTTAAGGHDKQLFWGCFVAMIATSFAFISRVLTAGTWGTEFGLTATQVGEILGAGLWPFAISIILFSLVIDHIGYKTAMSSTKSSCSCVMKEECLDRIVPLGEWHLRKTLHEFATHYHRERNRQGLANELIDRPPARRPTGRVRRRQRMGGILSYYYRSAA